MVSYTSFFNQTNIIGDPVVKPFTIGTPIQQQHGSGQQSFKPQNINQNFIAAGGKHSGFTGCGGSDMKGAGANLGGGQSASKQIGAHLVHMQQTAAKQSQSRAEHQGGGHQLDLISLLRLLG